MSGTGSRKGQIGGILLFLGAILLIVSLLSVWYTVNSSASYSAAGQSASGTGQIELKPGNDYTLSFSYHCTGSIASANCPSSNSYTCPYSGGGGGNCQGAPSENQTGRLYAVTQYLVIGGIVLGLLAGVLAILSPGRPGLRKGALALGILALLFALIAPMTLFALQPGAIKSDESRGNYTPNGTGPYSTFYGSCSGSSNGCSGVSSLLGNSTTTWGPTTGWYLSVGAFVVLLIGVFLVVGARGSSATPAPAPPSPPEGQT